MKQQLTLSQAIEGYLLDKRVSLKRTTLRNYSYALQKLMDFFPDDPPIEAIAPGDVTDLLSHYRETPQKPGGIAERPAKPLSDKSLLNIHAVLSSLWTWATEEGHASDHIMRRVPAPKPEKRTIAPLSQEDIKAMLKACVRTRRYVRPGKSECDNARPTALRDRAIVLLLLDTGIRASELCRLAIRHFDANNQRVKVFGKGAKERIIPVGRRATKALWRYLTTRPEANKLEPLFTSSHDEMDPLTRSGLYRLIKRLGERAGVVPGAHPHRFRHTFAINFLRNEGDPFSLQAILGHSTLDMVKRYLALAQTDTEEAHRRASPVDNWRL